MNSGEMNPQDRVACRELSDSQLGGARGSEMTREAFQCCLSKYSWKFVQDNRTIYMGFDTYVTAKPRGDGLIHRMRNDLFHRRE